MTKTEIKEEAIFELMCAMQTAFTERLESMYPDNWEEIQAEMSKQFARVEKLFGFVPYSWERGC